MIIKTKILYILNCSSFWNYKNETLDAINPVYNELKLFVSDMFESYFGSRLGYLCLNFQHNSMSCSGYTGDPPVPHKHDSILMNILDAVSKITNIVM